MPRLTAQPLLRTALGAVAVLFAAWLVASTDPVRSGIDRKPGLSRSRVECGRRDRLWDLE